MAIRSIFICLQLSTHQGLIPEMVSSPQSSTAMLMMSLIWKYYADPVTVLPSKWLFSSRANGGCPSGVADGVGIPWQLIVCNKAVTF
ncbi:guided entry of tail-anchored proteins factor 1-like isoform X2 [Oncorhynchus keta]|uniref:guided entry of tail-anchored proteins factor 1-like isoform X2 n=1 Tax=Oncorhynchus keta TaxID=8018 RepID=UPI0015FB326E|nr:guided entry of tail-anchored proteins factor 1-like isoform X2 [Oncorhynchus keta]